MATTLSTLAATEDPRMQANIFFGVRLALASLWDPVVLDCVCPPGGGGFDPARLLDGGTVYIQGTPSSQQAVGPLTALLVDGRGYSSRPSPGRPSRRRNSAVLRV